MTHRIAPIRYRPLALRSGCPLALPGLLAAIALAATDHPWWVFAALFIGSLEIHA